MNLNKIVRIVGVSGVGKSFILNFIRDRYRDKFNTIDFGDELKFMINYQKKQHIFQSIKISVKTLIDEIVEKGKPSIYTSHILFYNEGNFLWDKELEEYSRPSGFIMVESSPKIIRERRIRDMENNLRIRNLDDLEFISEYQDRTKKKVIEIVGSLGSRYICINNDLKKGLNKTSREDVEDLIYKTLIK